MKNILFFVLVLTAFSSYAQDYSRVRVYLTPENEKTVHNLGICLDHGKHKPGTYIETDLSKGEINLLKQNSINHEILIEDVQAYYISNQNKSSSFRSATVCNLSPVSYTTPSHFELGSMGGYFTYNEIMNELDSMFLFYPSLVKQKAAIDTFLTHQGRPLHWLKISDNPNSDEAEPELLITALHHAREPGSASQLLFFMWYILENYGIDPEITYLVDNTEIYFIPVVNPDGYVHNQTTNPTGGGMWRKNRRNNGDGTYGVDLNRNYPLEWGVSGTSTTTSSDVYLGPYPFSEPEILAVKYMVLNHDFKIALNYHTYGNLLLYPYGYDYVPTPSAPYYHSLSGAMVEENKFTNEQSVLLYPAAGDSDDWMYGDSISKPKIYAMTPEIGPNTTGFWPPIADILPLCNSTLKQNIVALRALHYYLTAKETGNVLIPSSAMSDYIHFDVAKLGLENTGTSTVELIPVTTNIASVGTIKSYVNLSGYQTLADSIAYTLSPSIAQGDQVIFILKTTNAFGSESDTIIKYFGDPVMVYTNDFSAATGYTTSGFSIATSDFYSSPSCITESPTTNYGSLANKNITTSLITIPSTALFAQLRFYAKWEIEDGYDYAQVQLSIDNGATFFPLCGKYTNAGSADQAEGEPLYDAVQNSWVKEEINLNDYIGQDVVVKFIFKTDLGGNYDGIYIDDLVLEIIDPFSVNEYALNQYLQVYPVPANNTVTISSTSVDLMNYKLISQTGQIIETGKINNGANSLDVSKLEGGFYFLQISNQKEQTGFYKIAIVR